MKWVAMDPIMAVMIDHCSASVESFVGPKKASVIFCIPISSKQNTVVSSKPSPANADTASFVMADQAARALENSN